jgi:23S rRNA (cytosine1962-C5)-methyltransferase
MSLCLNEAMLAMPAVCVNRKAADRVRSGHPWIFAGDVVNRGNATAGDPVRVIDPRGRNLGTAHYSSTSQIALRILTPRIEEINRNWVFERLEAAYAFRKRVVSNSDAYRLVHAEADVLPGLIVDRYADWVVIQLLDQGMDRLTTEIVACLKSLLEPAGIVARNDVAARAKESLSQDVEVLVGEPPKPIDIHMNGFTLQADLLGGQKTGVFLDQRENYTTLQRYASGRALDCFTATGGFALHLASRCESVEAVDSSAPALCTARANASRNNISNVVFHQADVLEYLPALVNARRIFDIVVVDPPAFTKSRSALEGAARGYKEINLRALRLLQRGGVLVSCSCSHHMTEAHLLEVIASAALDANKQLRVLERLSQAHDHPILLTVPETHYLKCLVFEVL